MSSARSLPLSIVTLVFGALSIPLAFARHLVSLAVVLALLAIAFGAFGKWLQQRKSYTEKSVRNSRWGLWAGSMGMLAALIMWWLWASNHLLAH